MAHSRTGASAGTSMSSSCGGAGEGQAPLLRLIGPGLLDDLRVEHDHVGPLIVKGDDALADADHVGCHAYTAGLVVLQRLQQVGMGRSSGAAGSDFRARNASSVQISRIIGFLLACLGGSRAVLPDLRGELRRRPSRGPASEAERLPRALNICPTALYKDVRAEASRVSPNLETAPENGKETSTPRLCRYDRTVKYC